VARQTPIIVAFATISIGREDELVVSFGASKKRGKFPHKKSPRKGGGGIQMAEKETREEMYETFSKLGESFVSVDGPKKAAAWYIDTTERVATQALELQEKATGWAKETPLASLFEAHYDIARKFIERSATAARNLWQIEVHHSRARHSSPN
jgi:hypothetical protein